MPDFPFSIYDTAVFGNSAKVVHTLFQVAVNQDSTHDRFFTNMRGSGQFPTNEKFLITSIEVFSDANFIEDDRENLWLNSYLQLIYKDLLILSIPLRLASGHNSFGGHFTQAVAADEALIGLEGSGYLLPRPQLIEGGNSFKAEVGQGTAMSAASQNVKVALMGVLTTQ